MPAFPCVAPTTDPTTAVLLAEDELTTPLILPALPLRGRETLRHPADLPDSSGFDPSGGAPCQEVLSVGGADGGGGWVVS